MKKFLLVAVNLFLTSLLYSQSAREVGVEIQASLDSNDHMVLNWLQQLNTTKYEVYQKGSNDISWDKIGDLSASTTTFTDTTYKLGTRKEYRVARSSTSFKGWTGNGYILAGFDVPAEKSSGRVLMVIEDKYQTAAAKDVAQYIYQIESEGYHVDTHYVNQGDKPASVKSWIENEWKKEKSTFTSVFLLGRVPVPYSGNQRYDGHSDHKGAWPADLYYGSFSLSWTDQTVNNTTASRKANWNVPGDGKFDLTRYNSSSSSDPINYIELPVGRVDLSNMPSFGEDTFLIKRYLRKSMAFRTGKRKVKNRGLVDDNFGWFNSEAFASGGFRNITTYAGDSISTQDYRTQMSKGSYLWSYACGGGTYTSATGVSSSSNFVNDSLLNPFTLLFGSYFGDWDNQNNFLRAPLASKGWGLASAWAGRPYWMVHECAHGKPLAKAVLSTYNTFGIYAAAAFMSNVHVSLMGDPTLRTYVVESFDSIHVASDCNGVAEFKFYGTDADSVEIEIWENDTWSYMKTVSMKDSSIKSELKPNETYSFRFRPLKKLSSASGTWWQYGSYYQKSDVFVDTFPIVSKFLGWQSRLCPGKNYTFMDIGYLDTNFTTRYKWYTYTGETRFGDTISVGFDRDTTMTFYVTRISRTGCVTEDSSVLYFDRAPKPIILQVENAGRIGDTVRLKALGGFRSFMWNDNASDTFDTYEFVASISKDTVVLMGMDYMGCESDTAMRTFEFVVNDLLKLKKLGYNIYPNPTSKVLTIVAEHMQPFTIKLFDNRGRLVKSASMPKHQLKTTWDLSGLSDGVYHLNISTDGQSESTKVIINR